MTNNPTGPELFERALSVSDLTDSRVAAINANTAALVMLTGLYAASHSMRSRELEVWADVIPKPPMTECWGKEARRPACAERHTEDCPYVDPVPEPKHVLLDVGTRVLVSDWERDDDGRLALSNPQAGRISGYDMHKSKYRWQKEWEPGRYSTYDSWAFVDNRVQVHPDGPVCPTIPEREPAEPTGPRIYVQNQRGKQGHVTDTGKVHADGGIRLLVQWHAPGARPVWVPVEMLDIIAAEDVERCENGQTRQECIPSDLCESCQQDDDAEGDEIEESMGLR